MAKRKSLQDLDENFKVTQKCGPADLRWHKAGAGKSEIRGLHWHDENQGRFCRLPLRAEKLVRDPVWQLAQCTAGARLCFKTDSRQLHLRVKESEYGVMPHMPVTGQCGLTVYEGTGKDARPRCTVWPQIGEREFTRVVFEEAEKRLREFTIYLPLYNGIESLEFGLDRGAKLSAPTRLPQPKPVVFYGTSITQGGCAHTPDGAFPSIVERALGVDTINLGFSGNGKGEPEMAELISEIDASLFLLDYVANVDPKTLQRTLPRFIKTLRAKHPETPIALISRIYYYDCAWKKEARSSHETMRDIILNTYVKFRKNDPHIHFIDGNGLLPWGGELVHSDHGVHPTSSGFEKIAKQLAPQVAALLAN